MTDEQKQKYKNNRKQFIENMTDEERQKYKEAINKRDGDRYNKMTCFLFSNFLSINFSFFLF